MNSQTLPIALRWAVWRAYFEVCKPRVVALIVFTAVVGMFLAVPGMVPWQPLVFGTLGIGLAASSGAALNHYLDRSADAEMQRTMDRPVPTGRLRPRNVVLFAIGLAATSMVLLSAYVNVLTAVLSFGALIGYAVIYTVFLKPATPQNIVIGGAAGAAPPVLGWCAVTGDVSYQALLLFLIIFVWTPPHFWALAVARRDEYQKARIPHLPVTHGIEFTLLQILLYSVLLVVVSILPYLTRMSGLLYLVVALTMGLIFVAYAVRLRERPSSRFAMRMFGYSILYLAVVFAALLADHYVPYTALFQS